MTPEKIELAKAIRRSAELKAKYQLDQWKPYPWQMEVYAAGAKYPQRMMLCGNRVGKTKTSAAEVAYHLTGEYPEWWPGHRFSFPPLVWALGVSGEQIRDVLQRVLFGDIVDGRFEGGLIRPDQVSRRPVMAIGTARLAKDVSIRHVRGESTLSLKSYSQGQHVLMGSNVDFVLIDEEPADPAIYPQVLTRTTLGNKGKGGLVLISETPELGATDLVIQYMENRGPSQFLKNATWDDAPHISPSLRETMLSAMPEYQREMRSKGIPVLGEGRIFTVAEERVVIDPFEIPEHWFILAAIDFGISHPTTVVWVAEDRDTGVIYITDEYSLSGEIPSVHAAAVKKRKACPVVYPHDADNREKGSGRTLADLYRDEGVNLDIKFSNPDGSNYVEPGIMDMLGRLREGRLKVFRTCSGWLREYRRYHRKDGKIVKIDDDLIDASRYAVVSVSRYGEQASERSRATPWDKPLQYR